MDDLECRWQRGRIQDQGTKRRNLGPHCQLPVRIGTAEQLLLLHRVRSEVRAALESHFAGGI